MPAALKPDWGAWIPANHPQLRWEGRVRFDADRNAIYDWASVRLHFTFEGTTLALSGLLGRNYLDVLVDGQRVAVLGKATRAPGVAWKGLGAKLYKREDSETYVVKGLAPGRHHVVVAKRTGPNWGPLTFMGFRLLKGEALLDPLPAPARRLEFIGDSLSNGYGDEGPGLDCAVLAPYENSSLAFPRVCAEALDADAQVLAFSGYGMVRNYGAKTALSDDPVPHYYPRTVLDQARFVWDRSRFVPAAAVVFLGTNDYSPGAALDPAQYAAGYHQFLAQVRDSRPGLPIFCAYRRDAGAMAVQVQGVVDAERAAGHPVHALVLPGMAQKDLGCDWHPKVVAQAIWAGVAAEEIRKTLHW